MTFTPQFSKKMKKSVLRQELRYKLQIYYFTICRWLNTHTNGDFTKPVYLPLLMEVSGVSKDEIFS